MHDTIHVEGIQSDLLWHLVPLTPAACGTYTVGHYGLTKQRIRTRWTRMNCALQAPLKKRIGSMTGSRSAPIGIPLLRQFPGDYDTIRPIPPGYRLRANLHE
jgi:hypothetical protein